MRGQKVKLQIAKANTVYKDPPGHCSRDIKYALPFYKSNAGTYIHRIRSSIAHWRDGEISHISISFWCGGSGFMFRGKMYSEIPEDGVCCATCEGRAIGAGLDGTREINGRPVMYSPKREA